MNSLLSLSFLCALTLAINLHFRAASANTEAYPTIPGTDSVDCSTSCSDPDLIPPRREVYDNGRIFDITHKYVPDMPVWDSKDGLGKHFLWLEKSMKNGSLANNSAFKLGVHTGTHVDAPSHFFDHYLDAGFDVDSLDLGVLNGKRMVMVFVDLYFTLIFLGVMMSCSLALCGKYQFFGRPSALIFITLIPCVL